MPPAPTEPTSRPGRLTRSVIAAIAWVCRHPRIVLAACLAFTVVSVHLAVTRLGYHTQRNDLLAADKDVQKRWQRYLDTFGDDDDMVVVAEGSDREQMKAALDDVAERVKARPDLFDRVFHRVDLRAIHNRALLFLPPDELNAIRARMDRMQPLLGPLASISWKFLSLETLLGQACTALEQQAAGRKLTPSDHDLLEQLPPVIDSAAATFRDPAAYQNPWALAGARTADRGDERQLTEPQYFFTPDGKLAMLLCRPKKASQSFTPAKEANEAMRAILAEATPRFPGVRFGLTGLPVLETDEMVLSDVDSRQASWLALLGVAILYLIVYRGLRYPLLTVASLLTGTAWALGWATVTVGHLNILSATFAVMLIGMGDYGVLWVARYGEGRKLGMTVEDAMKHTAEHAGPSIITASLTTSLAFFATMLVDFKAVAELGWIAGCGVLFCAVSCLTLVPAALALLDRGREPGVGRTKEQETGNSRQILPFPVSRPLFPVPLLERRPRLVLGLGAFLLFGCGILATRVGYDHNLLHLQPQDLDSVEWERKLIDGAAGMTWDAMSLARTRDEAISLRERYESLPEVGRVIEVASLVPADQEAKLPAVQAIHERLKDLPTEEVVQPGPGFSHPRIIRGLAEQVQQHAATDTELARAVAGLLRALENVPERLTMERLKEFDRRLVADLAADLNRLKAISRPEPILLTDLPADLRDRYVGTGGEYLVRAFARESLWDYDSLGRFTAAAAAVDPEATGKAFRTHEGLKQMKVGFEWAGLYALAAIVLVILLDFRRLGDLLLVLMPLGVGVVATLGILGVLGLSLNPANMIALPLIVGVGVDNGVHVLHDYRERRRHGLYRLGAATGRGVLVAGLTTVLGFGTLMTARHVGMAGLGLVLTLGVTCCMAAALVLLPAALRLIDERRGRGQIRSFSLPHAIARETRRQAA